MIKFCGNFVFLHKNKYMSTKMKTVLRWIGVLPASIIGMFIGYVFMQLNVSTVHFLNGDFPNVISITDIIVRILANAASGYAFVYAGTYTAPTYKKTVAIVLTVLYVIFGTISGMIEIGMNGIGWTFLGNLISSIAAVVACIVLCNMNNEDKGKETNCI